MSENFELLTDRIYEELQRMERATGEEKSFCVKDTSTLYELYLKEEKRNLEEKDSAFKNRMESEKKEFEEDLKEREFELKAKQEEDRSEFDKDFRNRELEQRMRIEEMKLAFEREKEEQRLKLEESRFGEELSQKRFFEFLNTGVTVGKFVLTLGFLWIWNSRGFQFEEEGCISSDSFRKIRENSYKFLKL